MPGLCRRAGRAVRSPEWRIDLRLAGASGNRASAFRNPECVVWSFPLARSRSRLRRAAGKVMGPPACRPKHNQKWRTKNGGKFFYLNRL